MKNIFSKKSLALLIATLVVFSSFATSLAVVANADATELDVWNGEIATGYAGGTGTEKDPFQIATPEQLALMAFGTNYKGTTAAYYELTADIYLNDTTKADWMNNNPKAWVTGKTDSDFFFNGTFNGKGHTIYGLYTSGAFERMGLFPGITGNVNIQNIAISDAHLEATTTAGKFIGAFVGLMYKAATNVTFSNCYVSDSVTLIGEHSVAGFVGSGACSSVNFKNCASFASVTNRSTQYTRYGSFVGGLNPGSNADSGARKVNYDGCIGNLAYTTYIQYPTYTASYCAVDGTVDTNSKVYPTVVALDDMKGEAAKTSMPDLDWNGTWATTDGFPVFKSMLPEAPACDHTNKETTDKVTKAATYFTTGLKDVVCECGETVEEDVVIPYDTATPVKFDKPVLNPETNELTVTWTYSAALNEDIKAAATKGLAVKFAFGDKEYTVPNTVLNTEGGSVTIEGINADRFNKTFSLNLEFTVDTYDTTTLNSVAVLNDVVLGGVIDNTSDKADEYTALIGAINTADSAVVAGAGTGSANFTAEDSSVDIKAGTATFKFVATQEFFNTVKANGTDNRTVKLVVTVDGEEHEVTINQLKTSIKVTIKGLSFEQMYGSVSAKLVITYSDDSSKNIDSKAVSFNFADGIDASENTVAVALEALLKN